MDTESSQQFCLRWHNHQSSVLGGLPALLDSGRLTDVTLCAGGRSLRAHRIVLSTCSPYFMDIFKELPSTQQPVVVVLGGSWAELCCLVAFMYAGEVTLPRALLPGLLRLARALRITGLTDLNGNIPEVPLQPEYDDTFNTKFESSYSTPDAETKLNRQNSDSTSAETLTSPFQKSFESHLAAKKYGFIPATQTSEYNTSDMMQDDAYQGIEMLKHFSSRHQIGKDRNFSVKEEIFFDGEKNEREDEIPLLHGKKGGKSNENKRYLNPVLNELEPKNRKIDKIVENLKCNQRKNQECNTSISRSNSQLSDTQHGFLNSPSPLNMPERRHLNQKTSSGESILPAGSKAADIFASNNIFMETDSESVSRDRSPEVLSGNIKSEIQSSPEIVPDIKYVPLSPGVQSAGIHSPMNAKLFATCYVCHKQLSNQYNLRVHLETHQNARHACVACSHVSRSRDALRKHVSYRHPQLNTSHGVGRPCKTNQNTQTVTGSPNVQTPPSPFNTPNMFNFPSTLINASDSVSLSASSNTRFTAGNSSASSDTIHNPFGSNESLNTAHIGDSSPKLSKDPKKKNTGGQGL